MYAKDHIAITDSTPVPSLCSVFLLDNGANIENQCYDPLHITHAGGIWIV